MGTHFVTNNLDDLSVLTRKIKEATSALRWHVRRNCKMLVARAVVSHLCIDITARSIAISQPDFLSSTCCDAVEYDPLQLHLRLRRSPV